MDTTSQTSVEARRSFLKKAAYAAPAVVALGALSTPKSAYAADSGMGPISPIKSFSHTKKNGVTWTTQYDTTTGKYLGATKIDGSEITTINQAKLYNDKQNVLANFFEWFGY